MAGVHGDSADGSFDFAQDDDAGRAKEAAGVPSASAGYAPLAHFYPALCATLLQGSTHVGSESQ